MRKSIRLLALTALSTVVGLSVAPVAASADLNISPPTKPDTAVTSWYSGTVSAGRSQTWTWHNANPQTAAYYVGLSPVGATTDEPCEFQVTRSWYEQLHSGERQFRFTIKNRGNIACGANILLSRLDTESIGSTGGVAPGDTVEIDRSRLETYENHLVAVTPSGATSSAACKFEVVGASYYRYHSGDVAQFLAGHFTVKNIGSIACSADVRLGSIMIDRSWSTGTLAAGATKYTKWNNANPLSAAHLAGFTPGIGCEMELDGSYYRQVINSNGSTEREFIFGVTNVDTTACGGEFTFTTI